MGGRGFITAKWTEIKRTDGSFLRAGFSTRLRDGVGGTVWTRWRLPAGWKGGSEGGWHFFLPGFCFLDTDAGRGGGGRYWWLALGGGGGAWW